MTSILRDLPPLEVSPGPTLVEPLPADRPVRWGILATGTIARSFATDLALLPDARLQAVGSRRMESAVEFTRQYGGTPHGSYEDLVSDPDVDIVYVATPHALHKDNTRLAFEAGKPVLCEKPLTLNAGDAAELVETAEASGLFLMEAMWMCCNPVIRRLQQLASRGVLGEVRQVRADLGFLVDRPATDRLLAPELGGGALLDMGVYPLTFAHLFLGAPDEVSAVATLSPDGIDTDVSMSLSYPGGAVAALTATLSAWSPRTATIATDRGRVDVAASFHEPTRATWTAGDEAEPISEPVTGSGLAHEAAEVMRCLRGGELQSPLVPWDQTLELMRLMDRIRAQIGLRYGQH